MKTFQLSEFARKPSDVTHEATRAPVALTAHRKPRFVLMAMEDYERLVLAGDTRQAYSVQDAPAEHVEVLLKGTEMILALGEPDAEASRGRAPKAER